MDDRQPFCYNRRMTYGEKAKNNFLNGYTCAQAVLAAFQDEKFFKESGVSVETAMKLASSFGGGMGRLREVCGAVSGMFMAFGLAHGFSAPPETDNEKAEHYKCIQELAALFKKENGSIVCRELLGLAPMTQNAPGKSAEPEQSATSTVAGDPYAHVPEARTAEYYKKRPCPELCQCAADILAEFLGLQGQKSV